MAATPTFDIAAAREYIRKAVERKDSFFFDLFLQTARLLEHLSDSPVATMEEIEKAEWFGTIARAFHLDTETTWDNIVFGLHFIGFKAQIPRAKTQQCKAFVNEVRLWSAHLSRGVVYLTDEVNPTLRAVRPDGGDAVRYFTLMLNAIRERTWPEAVRQANLSLEAVQEIALTRENIRYENARQATRIGELTAENLQLAQESETRRKERESLRKALDEAVSAAKTLRQKLAQADRKISELEHEPWGAKFKKQFTEWRKRVVGRLLIRPLKRSMGRFPYRIPGARSSRD
ncbi:MAG: hypothetical protein Q8R13_04215 [bacterium]|nr:hypothetical protein [bacterium]